MDVAAAEMCRGEKRMEHRVLGRTGLEVSKLSFGASSLGSEFRQIDEAEGIRAVHTALDLGINLIDVAPYYGRTTAETVLGKALRSIPRDRYYLETKVGRYGRERFDFSAERVTTSLEESLTRLNVEYVDLVQCHDIEFGDLDQIVEETIPALRKLQAQGKARFVGVTGLPLKVFRYVLDRTELDAILSYCHYVLNDSTLVELLPTLQEKGVGIINASPLSMRLLSNEGPPDWHPAPADVKGACARAAAFCREQGTDISRLAIQFSVADPDIATTLVGSANPENVVKNVRWATEPLDRSLLDQVLAILEPIQGKGWPSGRPENQ
jgi:aryl-alcohol dehydrogenase-like predicted oxidoreductase